MKAGQRRAIEHSVLGIDCPLKAPVGIEGRFPSGELVTFPPRLDPARVVVAEEIYHGKGVALLIDDESQPDFWMKIRIPREYLAALLRKVDQKGKA